MYLEIFLADFAVFRVFWGISWDFAEIPEFRGSATARNMRSPVSGNGIQWTCLQRTPASKKRLIIIYGECTVMFDYTKKNKLTNNQRAKKVVSDSPGLVNFVLNLPNVQVKFFEEFKLQKNCEINSAHQKVFGASWNDVWASIYSTCSFSLPKWQALKMTFFAPWSNKFTNLNGKYSALFYCSYF